MRRQIPLPGINADNNRLGKLTAGLSNQLRRFHSGCTQDDALYASFKQLLYRFQLADATTHLDRNQRRAGYLPDDLQITELTGNGTIKVNNMQPGCPQRLPLQSHLYRVVREYRFLLIVALIQANAFTISKVYSRNNFYGTLPHRLTLKYMPQGIILYLYA